MLENVNIKKLIETGNLEGVKSMIEKQNSTLSAIDSDGQSLLHYSCEFGQPEITKYLLSKGIIKKKEERKGKYKNDLINYFYIRFRCEC